MFAGCARSPEWAEYSPTARSLPTSSSTTLAAEANVVDSAWRHGVKKLKFLGSSCIYPKHAEQSMREDALLTGPLEPTNEWYAIARIAGIKLCQAYWR